MKFGKLTQRVGAVAVARLAGNAATIATNILLAWMLSKSLNGLIQKAVVLVQIAVLAGSFGIQTSLYYFLPRVREEQKRSLVMQSLVILLGIGLLAGGGVYLGAGSIAAWMGEAALVPLLQGGALAIVTALPAMVAEPVFIAQGRAWLAALNAMTAAAVQVVLVAGVLLWKLPAQYVFVSMALAQLSRFLPALVYVLWALAPGRWFGSLRGLWLEQLVYVLPVGLTSVVDAVSNWLDRTLVAHYFSARELATYSYGATEIPFISVLIGALTPVLLPEFSGLLKQGDRAAVLALWHRATRKAAIVLFGLFFVFLWVAPEFLATVYSGKYRDSALFFRIYLVLLPVRIVAFMPMLFALGKNRYAMMGALCEVLLNLAVSLLLIHRIGMAGAAWGTVISTFGQAWFYLRKIRQSLAVGWREILPWRGLAGDLAGSALFFAPLLLVRLVRLPDLGILACAGALYAAFAWYRILPRLHAA